MRLVATWFLVIVIVLIIGLGFSERRQPTESRSSGTIEAISPVPTWTNTAIASQAIRQERTPDSTIIGTALPPTSVPEVKNLIPTPTPQVPFATINHNMNIREGPGTNYPVIGVASVGQNFPIAGKNPRGDWWQITFNGRGGWVFGELVTAINAGSIQVALVIPAPPAVPTATRESVTITHPTRVINQRYIPISPAWEELYRNNEKYIGQRVSYSGVVIQAVQIDPSQTRFADYQLLVSLGTQISLREIVIMLYEQADYRLLENDVVKFVAVVRGMNTYRSIGAGPITVPYMVVLELDLVE